jgi:hypothetical protein
VKIHIGERPIRPGRCIKYVECPVVPTPPDRAALNGVAPIAYDPIDGTRERFERQSLDGIQQAAIARGPSDHGLEEHVCVETIEYTQHVLGPVLCDQVDGARTVELRVPRVQPGPDFMSVIVPAQTADDEVEVGQHQLRARLRFDQARLPARHGGFRDIGDVRDIGTAQAADFAQRFDIAGHWRQGREHGQYSNIGVFYDTLPETSMRQHLVALDAHGCAPYPGVKCFTFGATSSCNNRSELCQAPGLSA